MAEPLIVNDWINGMGNSPHVGAGVVRNADLDTFPGAVKVAKKPDSYFHSITERTFTANASTDECTASGILESTGKETTGAAVYFTTTGTLPAGLSLNTVYFLIQVSSTVFKVAASYKNSAGSAKNGQELWQYNQPVAMVL